MINPTKFLHYYPSLVNTSTVYRSFPQSPYSFQFQPISCYPLFSSEIRPSRNYRKLRQNSAHNSAALTVATTVTLALLFQHRHTYEYQCQHVSVGPAHNLLESVAQKIAISTLEIHKEISAVRVKVGKPHVAIPDPFDYL
ncbi:hypothetical protein RYX36_032011, partial [Vicia faba]